MSWPRWHCYGRHRTTSNQRYGCGCNVKRYSVIQTKRFRFVVTEAALHARIGPPAVQRGQLDRLLVLMNLDTVELAVIPLTARLPFVMHHGFSIEDEDLVLVETFSAELQLRDPDDVALYAKIFDALWGVAEAGERAAELVRRMAAE